MTPLDEVYDHQRTLKSINPAGSDAPHALDWIPSVAIPNPPGVEGDMAVQISDHEYPQNWPMGYKWGLVAIGALSVLSVTMTSSMMSAAIYDIRKHFPGHTTEMYIMGASSSSTHSNVADRNSNIDFRPRVRGRSARLGTLFRSLWPSTHVYRHFYPLYNL